MSRKILFRGKHIHAMDSNEHLNGTWMHGYLSDKNYIYDKILDGEFLVDESNWQIYKYNQGFFVKFPKEYFRNELGYWRNKVVVVGNVYDNPELL